MLLDWNSKSRDHNWMSPNLRMWPKMRQYMAMATAANALQANYALRRITNIRHNYHVNKLNSWRRTFDDSSWHQWAITDLHNATYKRTCNLNHKTMRTFNLASEHQRWEFNVLVCGYSDCRLSSAKSWRRRKQQGRCCNKYDQFCLLIKVRPGKEFLIYIKPGTDKYRTSVGIALILIKIVKQP
jgi:hypothetical protein